MAIVTTAPNGKLTFDMVISTGYYTSTSEFTNNFKCYYEFTWNSGPGYFNVGFMCKDKENSLKYIGISMKYNVFLCDFKHEHGYYIKNSYSIEKKKKLA